uniref:DHC_N2 domain-containing protein n=1 Tax=Ascaris lumbricoides TaxID=6252 RepID=A0A0M3I3E2_ASCLU
MSEGKEAILQQTRCAINLWVDEATALDLEGIKPIEKEADKHIRDHDRESMGKVDAFLGISTLFAELRELDVVKFM